jgi:hypothetical protein
MFYTEHTECLLALWKYNGSNFTDYIMNLTIGLRFLVGECTYPFDKSSKLDQGEQPTFYLMGIRSSLIGVLIVKLATH